MNNNHILSRFHSESTTNFTKDENNNYVDDYAGMKVINWNNVGILQLVSEIEEEVNYTNISIEGHSGEASTRGKLTGGLKLSGLFQSRQGRLYDNVSYETWYHIKIDGNTIYKVKDKERAYKQFKMYEESQKEWFNSINKEN